MKIHAEEHWFHSSKITQICVEHDKGFCVEHIYYSIFLLYYLIRKETLERATKGF